MGYEEHYEARQIIVDILRKDLVGPVSENEIIGERPLSYYAMGKLYPAESLEEAIEGAENIMDNGADFYDASINLGNQRNPSSMGITVAPKPGTKNLSIHVSFAIYVPREDLPVKLDGGRTACSWERKSFTQDVLWEVGRIGEVVSLGHGAELRIVPRELPLRGGLVVTLSLVNGNRSSDDHRDQNARSLFQPAIRVSGVNGEACFMGIEQELNRKSDPEILELEMLYRSVKCFGQGHGCSVAWDQRNEDPAWVESSSMPTYNLLQMKPASASGVALFNMSRLSDIEPNLFLEETLGYLKTYEEWICRLEDEAANLGDNYREVALANIDKCRAAKDRMTRSCEAIASDKEAFRAFRLANKAMFEQRCQQLRNTGREVRAEEINWYPFQFAFLLHEAIAFVDPESADRSVADLLWFPTGGGKTEAYLGVAAFAMFLRRIKEPHLHGVSVIMRYTLRLLTVQQFERASALVMACELIRLREGIGGDPISVGLWVGGNLTPNRREMARSVLEKHSSGISLDRSEGDPVQVKKCPWCGFELNWSHYRVDDAGMEIHCPNKDCAWHGMEHGLPIMLVDQDIYEARPSLIIATVDKFAQLAFNDKTGNLFGLASGAIPPDLIIQDELHLISGPTGTIVGLYEAAITKLCERDGIPPKIIAATATIRNAKSQIKSLYCEEHTQFPPQGLSMHDSFFAEISAIDDKPARLYAGVMAPDLTATTTLIRINAALLFATRYLEVAGFQEKVVDAFWTLVGYFNSLRELGGAATQVVDDVQARFAFLAGTKFAETFPGVDEEDSYRFLLELTSRGRSQSIAESIKMIEKGYTKDNRSDVLDFVLATNMISVGVDVGRLGVMVVAGQPKTNAEYIQATSRVGRKTPGLVVTLYNPARSRDRSHYEQFMKYHAGFYRYVESTSLTPFSDRARDRALHTLYVILCRYLVPGLRENEAADCYRRTLAGIDKVKAFILDYVAKVDPSEVDAVSYELSLIEAEWEQSISGELKYKGKKLDAPDSLLKSDLSSKRFRAMNSMRSVEAQSGVYLWERG